MFAVGLQSSPVVSRLLLLLLYISVCLLPDVISFIRISLDAPPTRTPPFVLYFVHPPHPHPQPLCVWPPTPPPFPLFPVVFLFAWNREPPLFYLHSPLQVLAYSYIPKHPSPPLLPPPSPPPISSIPDYTPSLRTNAVSSYRPPVTLASQLVNANHRHLRALRAAY
ncbi:hypothetical protein L226DRAFT_221506 [Lentinus tigrinus ALCF2SS1-7]|uniref:uncharacterized protein n=1 Tax=Lentinus tigrinus ALCF2SS1-7 TaxID=1328758 RepID=UPI0011662C9A|nr:hypothetical protein L226DRAFT_221506 [Lentinus tigrinus ALCF2SS1-7]